MSTPNASKRPSWINFAIIAWVSFLSAGVATMLFFATFDPSELANIATFPQDLSREAGYTIGFLLFWLLLVINNLLVYFLSSKEAESD